MRKKKGFIFAALMVFCLTATCFGTVSAAQGAESKIEDSTIVEEQEPVYQQDTSKYLTGEGVTLIGDSIVNGNRKIILEQLPDVGIDAKGSRDIVGGFEAAQKLDAVGNLSDVVIVELGTNGSLVKPGYYGTGMQNMLELLGTERQIFLGDGLLFLFAIYGSE